MSTSDLSADVIQKLEIVQKRLGAKDLNAALDTSLDYAYFVLKTLADPGAKLLVERDGKFNEVKGF